MVLKNGQEAVNYLSNEGKYTDKASNPLPFVIFLDLKLPYLDGFEVLTWIRQQPQLRPIVVVVLTGSDETRDHQKAYALGARSYLVKPPEPKDISQFINSMASYWGRSGDLWPVVMETD